MRKIIINKKEEQNGITLIALVITIIVLLILAGVTIAMLTGQNGILTQAQNAKTTTEYKTAEEKVKLSIIGARADDGTLTVEKLRSELANYGGTVEGDKFPITAIVDGKSFSVNYSGNITSKDKISKETPYVGYYADVDNDGTVDGIIYADLAIGNTGSGEWKSGYEKYNLPVITEGLKDYYISQSTYDDIFGEKPVLSPQGNGKDRFYVMALEDFNNGASYDWYHSAYEQIKSSNITSSSFGSGRNNTITMMSKWNSEEYGAKNQCSDHNDIWGEIQKEVQKGWFVPSMTEWVTYVGELGITRDNFNNLAYWSSSLVNDGEFASTASFYHGYESFIISNANPIRLSTTF